MGLFSNILQKLGIKKVEEAKPSVKVQTDSRPVSSVRAPADVKYNQKPGAATPEIKIDLSKFTAGAPPAPAAIPVVDVVAKLEKLAKANPEKLDWKVSIVDLLKLLGIDSSLAARKELAKELGCPADKMGDSASMNVWLHKTVLQKIAENGGNIPKSLLD